MYKSFVCVCVCVCVCWHFENIVKDFEQTIY